MKPGDLLLWAVVAVALVACGVFLGYSLWGHQTAPVPVTPTPTPVSTTLSPTPTPQTTPPPSPVGSWKLKAMTVVGSGGSSGVQYASGNITAVFGPLGRVQGSGGCNQYSGEYTTDGSSLRVTNIASTLMSCGNVLDTQERAYLMILGEAASFETDGATLTLRTASTPPEKLAFEAA